MSQGDSLERLGYLKEKEVNGRGRETVDDGLTTCLVKTFQLAWNAEKGNNLGEASVRTSQRKFLHRRDRDYLKGAHVEAYIESKLFRREKILPFSKNLCAEKKRV